MVIMVSGEDFPSKIKQNHVLVSTRPQHLCCGWADWSFFFVLEKRFFTSLENEVVTGLPIELLKLPSGKLT